MYKELNDEDDIMYEIFEDSYGEFIGQRIVRSSDSKKNWFIRCWDKFKFFIQQQWRLITQ